jgi:hypothetical protein
MDDKLHPSRRKEKKKNNVSMEFEVYKIKERKIKG